MDDESTADVKITHLPYYEGIDYDFMALCFSDSSPGRQPIRDYWLNGGRGYVPGCYRVKGGTQHD